MCRDVAVVTGDDFGADAERPLIQQLRAEEWADRRGVLDVATGAINGGTYD